MHPLILELAAGSDILHCVAAFARRRRVGLSILAGSGAVSSLALRQPAAPSATLTSFYSFRPLRYRFSVRHFSAAASGGGFAGVYDIGGASERGGYRRGGSGACDGRRDGGCGGSFVFSGGVSEAAGCGGRRRRGGGDGGGGGGFRSGDWSSFA
ncbi:AT-hook motif nuclear-localized protein 26-like [Phalaenopsis equestris]|uniref:AT-hook motif nuclear-localized protein 26-like n=1 Tax=Phalaenopsis equestris TaxID=78828 RepID=UPI0009E22F32|nr:AT-hook motif nuclear-localized protein 26-like [Phalaenopsis equestris]